MSMDRNDRSPRPGNGTQQEPTLDGVFDQNGIDLTVIRWMLALTPTERLRAVQDMVDAASALRGGHDP